VYVYIGGEFNIITVKFQSTGFVKIKVVHCDSVNPTANTIMHLVIKHKFAIK